MNALVRPTPDGPAPGSPTLARRLSANIRGAVLFDPASRGRYATDASIYQQDPIGVIVPETMDDVAAALAIAREAGVPVLPRGGGTSQCGQTVNRALVIDCSKHLRRVIQVDPDSATAWVEPGLVLGHLNAALRPHKLFFPVDPSTHARCTIGGMAGNNSCGSKSIRYGLMADNVLAIDAILADGSQHCFGRIPDNLGPDVPARIADLVQRLRALGAAEADEIAARFPKQLRRVGGYNIDALTPAARAAGRDSLARLLVGSEGTLAFSAALQLKLHPVKPRKVLGICQFPTFRAAMAAAQHIVKLDPEAVELVDRTMIDLGRQIAIYRATIDAMLIGEPDSVLIVEFHGHEDAPLLAKLNELDALMGDIGHHGVVHAIDPAFQADIAAVREAGLNIMMSMKGDGKPVSFIEDCAVDLEDLADYTARLNDVFEKHGTKGTWYAHASVGCLHVRPVLNMKDPKDVATMRAVAEEAFALVREYKGSHSGEHGDGLVRSEFHQEMFGPRIVRAFEAVKDGFDPTGLLNPNRIVRPPKMDDRALFRYGPDYAPISGFTPRLDWSDHPGPLGGMLGAVEMCNNNGTCRGFDAGVMCPSYRATRDEIHLTRGRANTLRLALSGQLGPDAMTSDAMAEAMALCVSCKACKRECPTGVDMAKMKLEVTAARTARYGLSRRDALIGNLPRYAAFAARHAGLANLATGNRLARLLGERLFGLAAGRRLPPWREDYVRDEEQLAYEPADSKGRVYLLADTFNRYFEPENVRAAMKVLAAVGYTPVIGLGWGRPLCCGRTYLASGQIEQARIEARRTMRYMDQDWPIVGLEPSCTMTLRDEFRSLLPSPETDRFAGRVMLLGEFLAKEKSALPFGRVEAVAHVHGHCHQKAFGAFPDSLAALRAVPGLTAKPIASSCCGMAGSFGYQAETQDVSRAMAEAGLLPAVRAAAEQDLIVADGTSCRHQIQDLAGRTAIHSVRVLERALAAAGQAGVGAAGQG
ncbi:MAG TPA: FAD-linked oxidase C-terminal domain-containing protein [Rhodopila sp.]|uniref:FAD-binding and (Fe-S)-binding domain-containing protein n=1 Tax=Rhodopila sp. TaxID=2480087 RepID=UPI002BD7EBA3|nr:FAD-linked oxidase C-terminal domain-containing protein [Rhodopila sp.]HVY17800.1 FAD-linked oxidase C-terminal domain-containing protein [Rhodopila sp.]